MAILTLLTTSIFGQPATSISAVGRTEQKLATIFTQSGSESELVKDFYMAGHDCYQHTLKKVTYLINHDGIIFFFNDALGNCILAEFRMAALTNSEHQGTVCYINNTIYQQLYTPQNKAAAFNYEASPDVNPKFTQMITILDKCASPLSQEKIILLLESSTQMQSTKPK